MRALPTSSNIHTPQACGRVLFYPPYGKLLFATDFHGQYEDFKQVVSLYQRRRAEGEDVYLLFAGDFVHGPAYARDDFPDFLGDYHPDESIAILTALQSLMAQDPRVASLLGNHEHAHIGGPATTKFHKDPDEVAFLEAALGTKRTQALHALCQDFSLVAMTPCGVMFTHAAPHVREASLTDVINATWGHYRHFKCMDMYHVPIIGELLWPRMAPPDIAAAFMERMAHDIWQPQVSIYGHEVCESGYYKETHNQLCVSTSFGLHRPHKTYLEIDLASSYAHVDDFQEGVELLRLY